MPYLIVDEPASNIVITCDGYILSFSTIDVSAETFGTMYQTDGTTAIAFIRSAFTSSATQYLFGEGTFDLRTVVIKENTPIRVIIEINGVHQTNTVQLPNENNCNYTFTLYPSAFSVDIVMTAESTGIVIDDTTSNKIIYIDGNAAALGSAANITNIHELNGSEADPGEYTPVADSNYLGFSSDVCNIIGTRLIATGTPVTRTGADSEFLYAWNNTTLLAGDHTQKFHFVVDSAEREGGKQYDRADATFSDDFNTGTVLDSNWTDVGDINFTVADGCAIDNINDTNQCKAYYDTSLGREDHWVKADIESTSSINDVESCGVIFRYNSTNETHYAIVIADTGRINLVRYDGVDTYTWIIGGTITTRANGTYECLAIIKGSTIQVYIDGILDIDTTDSTYSTGLYAGIQNKRDASTSPKVDNFSCGVFSADTRLALGVQHKQGAM